MASAQADVAPQRSGDDSPAAPWRDVRRRPHTSQTRAAVRVERRMIGLRVTRRWGPQRIAYHLHFAAFRHRRIRPLRPHSQPHGDEHCARDSGVTRQAILWETTIRMDNIAMRGVSSGRWILTALDAIRAPRSAIPGHRARGIRTTPARHHLPAEKTPQCAVSHAESGFSPRWMPRAGARAGRGRRRGHAVAARSPGTSPAAPAPPPRDITSRPRNTAMRGVSPGKWFLTAMDAASPNPHPHRPPPRPRHPPRGRPSPPAWTAGSRA